MVQLPLERPAVDFEVELQVRPELRLGHCAADDCHQHAAFPAEGQELAFDEADAEGDAQAEGHSGEVQKIFHARPAATANAGRNGRAVQRARCESAGRMPAPAGATADLVGAVADTRFLDRNAARAVAWLDP